MSTTTDPAIIINTTATDTAVAHTADGAGEEYARLDPRTLEVGPNVRSTVDTAAPDFRLLVDSITEHGVLQTISAIRTDDNRIVVIDGQQRTLAALEVGTASVPVLIRAATGTAKTRDITRLSQQFVTNERRIDLTPGQRAKAVTEMLDLGESVTKIGKAMQLHRDVVKTAGAAGRSSAALAALDAGQLDLEQAAIIAAFDADGDTAAVEELLGTRYGFRYAVQRLTADRAERRDRAAAAEPYAQRGFTILLGDPDIDDGVDYIRADDLVTDTGGDVTDKVIDSAPQHWAVWLTSAEQITDTATGDVVDNDDIDWDTEGDPEADAAEGLRHHCSVTVASVWEPEYFTADHAAAGVTPNAVLAAALSVPGDGGSADPATAAQARAQATAAAELAAKERQRSGRRRTIALNKASAAATLVRIDWLSTFLARKTAPKGASQWITATLVDDPSLLTENKAPMFLASLLNVSVPAATGPAGYPGMAERTAREAVGAVVGNASDARAQVLLLAQILAAYEARMSGQGRDSWRRTSWGHLGRYLTFLGEHGHHLTPVEQSAAAMITAEQAHTEHTTTAGEGETATD